MSRAAPSEIPFVHLRSGDAHFLIPLTRRSLGFALRTWPMSRRWRLVERFLHIPGGTRIVRPVLAMLRPATKDSDEKLLASLGVSRPGDREMVAATSWRGEEGATTLFLFGVDDQAPTTVTKLAPVSRGAALRHEAGILGQLGPAAESAGARVPHVIEFSEIDGRGSLILSSLVGQSASVLLRRRPGELAKLLDKISDWLERWSAATRSEAELTRALCEELILGPARALALEMANGCAYTAWLERACEPLVGCAVPFVSAHYDLTMSNVLVDGEGRIGVVDWEEARANGLPLADFWYSACDALVAAGDLDRPTAFAQCFATARGRSELIEAHERQLRSVVGGPSGWIDLCFHACWLQHGANEQARPWGDERPFLEVVNRLSELALEQS
jgi:phosphotransferase family enzyme